VCSTLDTPCGSCYPFSSFSPCCSTTCCAEGCPRGCERLWPSFSRPCAPSPLWLLPFYCPRCFPRFTKHRPNLRGRSPGHRRRLPQVPRLWRRPARLHLRHRLRRHPQRRLRPLHRPPLRRRLPDSNSARYALRTPLLSAPPDEAWRLAETLTRRVDPFSIRCKLQCGSGSKEVVS
jgi:hypothetical protein